MHSDGKLNTTCLIVKEIRLEYIHLFIDCAKQESKTVKVLFDLYLTGNRPTEIPEFHFQRSGPEGNISYMFLVERETGVVAPRGNLCCQKHSDNTKTLHFLLSYIPNQGFTSLSHYSSRVKRICH